ncbi:MAG: glycosyltransferase family 47 protein, partial [Gammaproteobacteria bacterium]|nr:glycosyltransferase family 47 protein [Gammaproteobacteria bacterium]
GCYPRAVLDGTIPNYSRHLKTPFLYSFVGAVENHPVRRSLVALSSNEGLVIDTSNGGSYCDDERVTRYSNSLRDSLFVLCPRGGGTSSFRLFEAMKAGRIPVIISDRWEPPSGLDWSKFSLQIREADVLRIPEVLSKLRPLACSMCAKSREAWEQWFSPDSYFHRVVQWCGDIRQHQVIPGGLRKIVMTPVIFHPEYFRSFLLSRIRERLKAFDQF